MSRRRSTARSGCRPAGRPSQELRDRGLSPVVGKTLELGIGVLFVALLTAMFFGSVAPDYRAAVGAELGDRTVAAAADRVETAVPDTEYRRVDRHVTVRLPETIRGDPYRIVAADDPPSVRLAHPDRAVGSRLRLDVPGSLTIRGSWRSTSPSQVVVASTGDNVSVRLTDATSEGDADGSAAIGWEAPP